MSDDYDRVTDLAAIRERAARGSFSVSGADLTDAIMDRLVLLARLDVLKAERDAIARDAEATIAALNAALGRLGEQRDSAYARLSSVCMYLERMALHTPEHERQITAIHMQLGPRSSRIDELP